MTASSPQELAATVRAGIARERQQAQAAGRPPWMYGGIDSVGGGSLYDRDVMIASLHWDNPGDDIDPRIRKRIPEATADATGAHMATHDPARVLADCDRAEADLAAWKAVLERHSEVWIDGTGGACDSGDCNVSWPCPDQLTARAALARLAATYGGEG